MIGHPNNSGLQMDQVTQLYIPAFFVNELHIWQDDSPVLAMEGGISISEDPNIRFTYVSNGARRFRAEARTPTGTSSSTNGRSRIPGPEGSANSRSRLETADFSFGLGAPEVVECVGGLLG